MPMTLTVALENVRVLFIQMQELSLPKKAYTVCDLEQARIYYLKVKKVTLSLLHQREI